LRDLKIGKIFENLWLADASVSLFFCIFPQGYPYSLFLFVICFVSADVKTQ